MACADIVYKVEQVKHSRQLNQYFARPGQCKDVLVSQSGEIYCVDGLATLSEGRCECCVVMQVDFHPQLLFMVSKNQNYPKLVRFGQLLDMAMTR